MFLVNSMSNVSIHITFRELNSFYNQFLSIYISAAPTFERPYLELNLIRSCEAVLHVNIVIKGNMRIEIFEKRYKNRGFFLKNRFF